MAADAVAEAGGGIVVDGYLDVGRGGFGGPGVAGDVETEVVGDGIDADLNGVDVDAHGGGPDIFTNPSPHDTCLDPTRLK